MIRDWLLGLDPGFQRMRHGLRALLSIVFSVAALYEIGLLIPISLPATMLAGLTAMLASMGDDENRRKRLLTTALLPLPILFAVSVGAFFGGMAATMILLVHTRDAKPLPSETTWTHSTKLLG